jgi:two-component system sensor histidine kinase BarA
MQQGRSFWGIRAKLVLLVCVAVGFGTTLVAGVSIWQEANRYTAMKRDTMLAAAHVLASASAKAVSESDATGVHAAVRSVGKLPSLVYAGVTDARGVSLSDVGTAEMLDSDLKIDEKTETIGLFALLRSRTIELDVPIVEAGVEVGSLKLVSDTTDLPRRLWSSVFTTALGGLGALFLSLLVALQLQRSITRPLIDLTRAMTGIGEKHDYAVALEATTNDEVGVLVDGFNSMMSDIRERDIRLAHHREHLEQQVAERTRDYREARDAAEAANSAKSGFLATMSHEIRTPMNGILVMAELLAAGDLPARSRRFADVIARSGQSLLAIINDILDFSKIEAGKLEVEQLAVDPVEVADTVVSLFHERAQSKSLDLATRVAVDLPDAIEADPVRLNQVLGNLVNNALKFTEKGSVQVTIERDPRDVTRARFSVTDTGIGIPKDKVATIFEAFSQADETTTRRFGGTGLGLSIANRLVAAMGGKIEVTSEVGRGSTFFFSLRFATGAKTRAWPVLPPVASGKPLALVCLTGPATLRALADYLEASGFTPRGCRPEDFEREAERARLIIADSRVLQGLARRAGPPDAAIVAVSGLGESGEDALMDAGLVDAMLQRPLMRSDVAIIMAALRDGKSLAENRKRTVKGLDGLPNFAGKRVLVADDSAVNREVALEALRKFNVTIDLVEDGKQAVEAVEKTRYDLVLLDGSMPVMDGFEAARRMRARENGKARLPIVALTAHVVGSAADLWRSAGMDGVLHKPFTIAAMAECLRTHMGEPQNAGFVESEEETEGAIHDVPAAPVPEDHEDIPVLDPALIEQLREMARGGRTDFVERVTGLYREHAPTSLVEVEAAHAAADLERLGAAAHGLKSMSLNIGAKRVSAAAAEIEHLSRQEGVLPSAELIAALRSKVEEACDELMNGAMAA